MLSSDSAPQIKGLAPSPASLLPHLLRGTVVHHPDDTCIFSSVLIMTLLNPLAAMRANSSHSSSENTAVSEPVPATNTAGAGGRPRSRALGHESKLDTAVSVAKEKQDERTDGLEDREVLPDGRVLLTEEEAYPRLGFSFPTWKKWTILSVIFAIQCSMNLNSSLYANAVSQLSKEFHVSEQVRLCLSLGLKAPSQSIP